MERRLLKVVAPVKTRSELLELISIGVDEFYAGVVYDEWNEKYGKWVEFNRRGNYMDKANVANIDELCAMLKIAKKNNVKLYFTLNALKISFEQHEMLRTLLLKLKEHDLSGVIISSLEMADFVNNLGIVPIASSCANIDNHYTASLFIKQGCKKIIFPRYIDLDTMRRIKSYFPEIEFEAFILNSGCRYVDGNCLSLHGTKEGCQCVSIDCADYDYGRFDGKKMTRCEINKMSSLRLLFQGLMNSACGQCYLFDLIDMVDSVKVIGRVSNFSKLKSDIIITKRNIDIAHTCCTREEYLSKMLYIDKNICKEKNNCYYV